MAEKPKDTKKQKKSEKEEEGDAEEEIVEDPSNADVVTKYRKAGDIANSALQLVIKACTPGAKVLDLCNLGDKYITDETGKVFNNKKTEKGIGFPTCISINNVVGHYSPVTSDVVVKENDVVKIDLGVHIDGYVAVVAHTIVVNNNQPVKGRQADVLAAAYTALECAVRLLKPGHKNSEITEAIGKAAADFKCNAVQGVLSHQMQRFEIDAPKVILNRADVEQKVDEFAFALNEVYALDIVMSTGEGKPKESDDDRTTVFKRSAETVYQLKMQASRAFFSDVKSKFPSFPFTMRAMEDEKKARLGVKECLTHGLLTSYPVLLEKEGEFVAHLKTTLLLTANGTLAVTGLPIDRSKLASECKVSEDTQKLLNTSKGAAGGAKKKKGKGKKKGGKEGAKKEGAKKEGKSDAPASAKKEDKPKDKAAESGKKSSKKQEETKKEEAPKSSKKDSKKVEAPKEAASAPAEAPKSTKKDSKKPAEEPKQAAAAEGSKKKESKKQESGKAAEPKAEAPKSSKKVSKGGQ